MAGDPTLYRPRAPIFTPGYSQPPALPPLRRLTEEGDYRLTEEATYRVSERNTVITP